MEMPATVGLSGDVDTRLQLVDISLGGVKLWIQRGLDQTEGNELELEMKLGDSDIKVKSVVRHTNSDGMCGVEFVDVTPETHAVLNDYVSELAERGAMA
jgi:c-di-GMP-binding flagellar brake protein YcgR